MERCGYLSKEIAGWENDYKNLKKYRFMRTGLFMKIMWMKQHYVPMQMKCGLRDFMKESFSAMTL